MGSEWLPFYDALNIVEFVEGFQGGEAINVETQDFIAYLSEDGIVKLEKT